MWTFIEENVPDAERGFYRESTDEEGHEPGCAAEGHRGRRDGAVVVVSVG